MESFHFAIAAFTEFMLFYAGQSTYQLFWLVLIMSVKFYLIKPIAFLKPMDIVVGLNDAVVIVLCFLMALSQAILVVYITKLHGSLASS